ncbi:hypothetical protein PENSUB_11918 [Penicillium subrubescens]|uniref:Uncharacterized protein n=2 Tax=Penicillium subrubescens TaxID=1316194 RepID=A0A1Q5T043_9EURO|nr:hypothetical protein PENSUB_11918 [Penicillium subrubescens]
MKGQQYRLQYIPQEGFLRYSGAYWMSHVKRSHNLGGEWIRKVVTLCEAGSESAYWISYHEGYSFWELCRNHNTARQQSLFWVAHWALTEAVIFLVDDAGAEVSARPYQYQITQPIVETVPWNEKNGKALTRVLLDQRGVEIEITEEVVWNATLNEESGEEILNLLLDRRGAELKITQKVLRGTMTNLRDGSRLMRLLLNRGVEIKITDKVYEHAASYWHDKDEMMQLLRNRRAADLNEADVKEADVKQADLRAAEPRKGWLSYFFGS